MSADTSTLPSPDNAGYVGPRELDAGSSPFNAHAFLIQQILNRIATATLVRVEAVTNEGGVSPVGSVDVHPLVNQLDGLRNATPHGTIFSLPYFRVQGGTNAVILDPQIGDIGIAIFADHDISSVKATLAEANPGSARRFDMADGIYIGGMLNGMPVQWVRFSTDGIEVNSPTLIKCIAPTTEVDGNMQVNGNMLATGMVIAGAGGADQVKLQTHIHPSNGAPPTPGT